MMTDKKTVLVLAPHTDDGELGAGATIAKMVEDGAEVHYAAFSTCEKSVPEGFEPDCLKLEVKAATSLLGIEERNLHIFNYEVRKLSYFRQEILEDIIDLRSDIAPDIVFVPSPNDLHQDHATVSNEGVRAFKFKTILGYEMLWNNISFNTTAFVKLEKRHVDKKLKALQCYKSQEGRPYMSQDFIEAHAKVRGIQIGHTYAEAFEMIRGVLF